MFLFLLAASPSRLILCQRRKFCQQLQKCNPLKNQASERASSQGKLRRLKHGLKLKKVANILSPLTNTGEQCLTKKSVYDLKSQFLRASLQCRSLRNEKNRQVVNLKKSRRWSVAWNLRKVLSSSFIRLEPSRTTLVVDLKDKFLSKHPSMRPNQTRNP